MSNLADLPELEKQMASLIQDESEIGDTVDLKTMQRHARNLARIGGVTEADTPQESAAKTAAAVADEFGGTQFEITRESREAIERVRQQEISDVYSAYIAGRISRAQWSAELAARGVNRR